MSKTLGSVAIAALGAAAALGGCGEDEVPFGDTGAGGASSSSSSAGGSGGSVETQIAPAPGGARRLLARQYVNSLRLILGDEAAAAALPPTDHPLHGFSAIGNAEVALPAGDVEQLETSAFAVARAAANDPTINGHLSCDPGGADPAGCYAELVESVANVAWRRPVEASEIDEIVAVAEAASEAYFDPGQGVVYALATILQAPDFLYVVELGDPAAEDPTKRPLTPRELATRISLFLTDTTPSQELLDAAAAGDLESEEGMRALATEMLQRPEAREALRGFFGELFELERLPETSKNADAFPLWNEQLAADLQESAFLYIDDIVWERDADYREMLDGDYVYVNNNVATVYDVAPPGGSDFARITVPGYQLRNGIMGHAGMMSLLSHIAKTSPTKRGVFVRRTILCEAIPPPPPGVEPTLPDDDGTPKTTKEKLQEHFENESCAACHAVIDPLGLAFENFDGIGQFRTHEENGLPIDPSGEQPDMDPFANGAELGVRLADHHKTPLCIVRNVFRHSMGHLETEGEEPALDALFAQFEENGYSLQSLLVDVVASPAFRLVGEPK